MELFETPVTIHRQLLVHDWLRLLIRGDPDRWHVGRKWKLDPSIQHPFNVLPDLGIQKRKNGSPLMI